MFAPGYLTAAGAALLNEMARQYQANGFRIGVTSWPLTVSRPGRMQGTIIGIDPKAFRTTESGSGSGSGDGSGSGTGVATPTLTVVTDFCLSPGGDGGFFRKAIINPVTGEVIDEFCEPIPTCGSGENGGLCDDLPPPSGSGSGSGSGWTPEGCPTGYALHPGNVPWTRIDEDTWTNGTLTMTRAGVNWQIIDSATPSCLWENNGWDGTITPGSFVTFGEVSGNCVTDYEIQCYVP